MKLLQIRQFVTLAQELNFHRAANVLNMAQPPLSVSIRKLEEELGTPLFLREPRGVRLTVAGEAALPGARQLLQQADELRRAVRGTIAGEQGTLSIGFVASATYELLPQLLPGFRERFPQVELKLEESRTAELVGEVDAGRIDVAIVRTPVLTPTNARIDIVQRDNLVVAVSTRSPLAKQTSLNLLDLRDEPFVAFSKDRVPSMHAITMLVCQRAGFVPKIGEEAGQLQTILCLVESGLGVALVPGVVERHAPGVKLIPIRGNIAESGIGLGLVTGAGPNSLSSERFRTFALDQTAGSQGRGR